MRGVRAAGRGHAAGCLLRVPGHRQRARRPKGAVAHCQATGQRAVGARPHGVREAVRGVRRHRPAAASALRARAAAHGRAVRTEAVTVHVPPGDRRRRRGCGSPGRDTPAVTAAATGDLYVTVHVAPHPLFRREGDDLHIDVPVAVHEAALGARIEVPSLDGPFRLTLPPGTQSGQRSACAGAAAPTRDGGRGDLIVRGAAGAAAATRRALAGADAGVRPAQQRRRPEGPERSVANRHGQAQPAARRTT